MILKFKLKKFMDNICDEKSEEIVLVDGKTYSSMTDASRQTEFNLSRVGYALIHLETFQCKASILPSDSMLTSYA